MGFWPRLFCAIVCWFLTMLALTVAANHYLEFTLNTFTQKLLFTMGAGISILAAIMIVLTFWVWVWTRKYYD